MFGLGTITRKVFGTQNDRKVKSVRPLIEKINALEPEFEALSDAQLIEKTAEFKSRYENGETLDALLQRHLQAVVRAPNAHLVCARLMFS